MEPHRDDSGLAAELRALRPEPRQEFAAELDERAAAGFPRRSGRSSSLLASLLARLRALPPRRLVLSAGATALAAVAVATVVVAVSEPRTDSISLARLSPSESGRESSGVMYETEIPTVTGSVSAPSSSSSSEGLGGAAAGAGQSRNFDGAGPYASKASHRDVERSVEMVLGAEPADVAGDAAAVFDAVHAVNGIVLSSSGTGERLRDSRAKIDGLLVQLAGADSEEERSAVEAELRAERRHAAALRSQAAKLGRRANLSRVSLRIVTDPAIASPGGSGGWSVDDALGDAGHILAIAAAVTIVGLAILAPLALIALLAWLANRARIRRGRERALA